MATGSTERVSSMTVPAACDECGGLAAAESPQSRPRGSRGGLRTRLMGVEILGTGSYLPGTIVRNEDLTELGCDADWIVQRTGILQRRRAAPGEATSDLAYEAARRCLASSGVAAADVDLILVATMTPDMATPSVACLVQRRLGSAAPAMDLNAEFRQLLGNELGGTLLFEGGLRMAVDVTPPFSHLAVELGDAVDDGHVRNSSPCGKSGFVPKLSSVGRRRVKPRWLDFCRAIGETSRANAPGETLS